ncbi:MAG: tRNA pseudouridine(13) synthase TruD [Candidatus Micrarchaeota archaeon]
MNFSSLAFLSRTPGIRGKLKQTPEDFLVEEIAPWGEVLEIGKQISRESASEENGEFLHFVLQKKNWNTAQAMGAVARAAHASPKRFNYAGTKDRNAITTQRASAFALEKLDISVKDIQILGQWRAKEKVRLGDLLGNRFTITLRGVCSDAEARVEKIAGELQGVFPNYFGEQRFGSIRRNTHLVGKEMVRGDFKSAVLNYLTYVDENEEESAKIARKNLAETLDYARALNEFPQHLKYERTMLMRLAKEPKDFVNAMRLLPRGISLLFIHAYQSALFNELLSERVREGSLNELGEGEHFCALSSYGFPEAEIKGESKFLAMRLIGYDTKLNERERALLERECILTENFKIRSFPELGSKGSWKCALAPLKNFVSEAHEESMLFKFELPSGSYATMALREFIEVNKKTDP